MSDVARRIDSIISTGLAPLLKRAGFKKKARNFTREHADRVEVINVQASKWNSSNEIEFTVNVGVFYPAIAEISDALKVAGTPKQSDCTVRTRIGWLKGENNDHWWKVHPASDDSEVAKDLAWQVEEDCFLWLALMSNLDAVKVAVADDHRHFIAAAIALYQGNRNEAESYVDQAIREQPGARAQIAAWAKKHHLRTAAD